MPTKRTRVERRPKGSITAAAVEMYREAKLLHEKRMACIDDKIKCEGTESEHCRDCRRYIDLSVALQQELKIKPWQHNPLRELPDTDIPFRALERAQALQNELEAAIDD